MTHELCYVGVTQKTAPLAVREKLGADPETQSALLAELSHIAQGRLVLPTCERFEVYTSSPQANVKSVLSLLARWFEIAHDELASYVQVCFGLDAAEHLLRVSAGLESRIVGERQILGQVRNAHQTALAQNALDAQLSALAQTAVRTGKRVRHETDLGAGSRSIVTTSMEWLADRGDKIAGRRVAVVGTGRLAALVLSEASLRNPRQMIVTGRNHERALKLAKRFEARCADLADLKKTLAESDIVFACTASPTYLIDVSKIEVQPTASLLFIDLCVPRNVDPEVAMMRSTRLVHLDEMMASSLCDSGLRQHAPSLKAIHCAQSVVREELESFRQWRCERRSAGRIVELVERRAELGLCKRAIHQEIMRIKAEAVR